MPNHPHEDLANATAGGLILRFWTGEEECTQEKERFSLDPYIFI
jgi:hypothetical protein